MTTEAHTPQELHFGLRSRWLRRIGSSALTVAVALASAFVSSLIAQAASSGPAKKSDTTAGAACDHNGVSVGYDVAYERALAGYGVTGVHVIGIDPGCSGATIQVSLADEAGRALADGTVSQTIGGETVDMPLSNPVDASAVRRVYVSLEGQTEILPPVAPPATTTTSVVTTPLPATTTTSVVSTPLPVTQPSLCSSVSGVSSATAESGQCGAVVAGPPPTASGGTTTAPPAPVAVASWRAQVFTAPVQVTLQAPAPTSLPASQPPSTSPPAPGSPPAPPPVPAATIAPTTALVQLTVTDQATGQAIHSWTGVMAIDFASQNGPFRSAYSEDGVHWHLIPQLGSPSLPDGQPDGYFVHPDKTITVYTRHATYFAIAPNPSKVSLVYAKLLPSGGIRLTWTPSVAGLGVAWYLIVRDNHVWKTVSSTKAIALVPPQAPGTFHYQVIAVDPIGTRSETSAAARIQVPLIVGPQRVGMKPGLLLGRLRLTSRAWVRVFALAPNGKRLTILPGSTVSPESAGSTRVRVVLRRTSDLHVGSRPAGGYDLALRVPPSQLGHGPFRVVVIARTSQLGSRAEIRFGG